MPSSVLKPVTKPAFQCVDILRMRESVVKGSSCYLISLLKSLCEKEVRKLFSNYLSNFLPNLELKSLNKLHKFKTLENGLKSYHTKLSSLESIDKQILDKINDKISKPFHKKKQKKTLKRRNHK